ncbi:AfsR/SARP family transcriptional regulator [Paractinoplanes rishiriensis]|uniref:SARP family transcriptional regulator n=1 Tax=Paractinoplanes rishiriensis TaxID=1050105 RepID=A0A919K4Q1_9ACTN|nr:AfsR/SARP family transcriptional regulator [Actinoplanes rishiriensis]GIE99509.1 hypothetical protein Ari01nite_69740 [Actinoplanes rishiriensis]
MLTRDVRDTEIRVLGAVEIWAAGRPLHLPRRQLATVIGLLALQTGQVVSFERMIDVLWPDHAPKTARAVLQTRVSELRALLQSGGFEGRLITHGDGYSLSIPPEQIDATRFCRAVSEARRAVAPPDACRLLRAALGLWRGPVLGGPPASGLLDGLVRQLDSQRLTAIEDLLALETGMDTPHNSVDEFVGLTASNPERERLTGQIMLALQRAGRTAEAFTVYERTRRWLADELGVDPGAELQGIHLDLLRATSRKAGATARDTADPPAPATPSGRVPRTLPSDLLDFTGRAVEAGYLADLASRDRGDGVLVMAVCGQAGVGKTALTVHVAHHLQSRFGDGQLYADLHGTNCAPATPHDVLGRFLRALGTTRLPDTLDERIDVYRDLLADRRMLVVLDDAMSDEQVRPLIPGGSGCVVLVNGRPRLGAALGARTLRLDVLSPADAVRLLSRVVGGERVKVAPAATAELARACGHLPLALRIAGARLQSRPHWTVSDLAGRLRDESHRLDELAYGPLDVRHSIAGSIASLGPEARRLLRRLAALNPAEITAEAAAALLAMQPARADDLLEELYDAHLVEPAGREPAYGRHYRMPDLVRLGAQEPAPECP